MKLLFVRTLIILLTCLILNNCFGQTLPDPGDDPLHNQDSTVKSVTLKNTSKKDSATCSDSMNSKENLFVAAGNIIVLTTEKNKLEENKK
ncbi:MAG: hypothetical protein ACTHJN_18040 [Ginsengibacter sp.]